MKVFVCCLFIIANISNNGKASLESFAPSGTNILFEDTTKNLDKVSCYRPCKFNVKPKRCHYNFKVEPTIQEDGRPAITINGMTPGPPIQACVNDIIVVEVQNNILDQDISIHWHGIEQKGTPYMDGVPMVTQCPIGYGQTFKYAFVATSPGTFFYHADSVSHQSDGVYGPLIINQPQPLEHHSSLYDYDRSAENTLTIGAKFPELLTAKLEDVSKLKPDALIINGDGDVSKIVVMAGFAYRLRFINAIATECPVIVTIEKHEMVVIATDGKPTKPVLARNVELHPGERMDAVVRASEEGGGYWVRVHGTGACTGLGANAMLIYSGFNYTAMLAENQNEYKQESFASDLVVSGQMLESLQDQSHASEVKSVYLGIDRNTVQVKEADLDFRYISDAIPKKPFFPAAFALHENGVVQINKKSFLYPNVPILLRPRDVRQDMYCKVGEEETQVEAQCIQVLDAIEGEVLEIALVNEGFGSNDSYTFHMHGYNMQVISTWQNPKDKPISKEDFQKLSKDGKISRNLQNPPVKDTITVPNKGYTIVRIKIDRGGTWLLECRSCALSSVPAAIMIRVPETIPKAVVDSLPKCGNYRPPDVLLN
ncbi:laccase-2-like [Spodoptera litura]|uniref:Laccase-2-like n=1 Tax=Spodoptera litura TaxID=69820 RepID=A0A9J7E2D7_SPOLT|nr:laccase-2-like [Spodoptera litura]